MLGPFSKLVKLLNQVLVYSKAGKSQIDCKSLRHNNLGREGRAPRRKSFCDKGLELVGIASVTVAPIFVGATRRLISGVGFP